MIRLAEAFLYCGMIEEFAYGEGGFADDFNIHETGLPDRPEIILFHHGAGNAADIGLNGFFQRSGQPVQQDDVGDHQPAAWFENPEGLPEDPLFVGGEVDDAIRNNDINGTVG